MARIVSLGGADLALWSEQWHFPVVPGEQYWLLLRSGAGDLEAADVESAAAELVQLMVAAATGVEESALEAIRTGAHDWTLGEARPLSISVSRERPALPAAGRVLARRETFPGDGVPSVTPGTVPWYALVHLWWRGKQSEAPWPIFGQDAQGISVGEPDLTSLTWTLDTAFIPRQLSEDPGDMTWGEAQAKRLKDAAGKAAGTIAGGLLGGAQVVGGLLVLVGAVWAAKTLKGFKK